MTYRHMIQREVICCFHRSQKVRRIHFHCRKNILPFRPMTTAVVTRTQTKKKKLVLRQKKQTNTKLFSKRNVGLAKNATRWALARESTRRFLYHWRERRLFVAQKNSQKWQLTQFFLSNDPLFLVFFHLKCNKNYLPSKDI